MRGHAITNNHKQSQTITNNHKQSRTITSNHEQSRKISNNKRERNRSNAMVVSRPPLPQRLSKSNSSAVISGHQRSSVVIGGDMTTQALLTDVQPDMQSDTQSDMQSDAIRHAIRLTGSTHRRASNRTALLRQVELRQVEESHRRRMQRRRMQRRGRHSSMAAAACIRRHRVRSNDL